MSQGGTHPTPRVVLGKSLSEFMRKLDLHTSGGSSRGRPDPAPQPDETALSLHCLTGLRG